MRERSFAFKLDVHISTFRLHVSIAGKRERRRAVLERPSL